MREDHAKCKVHVKGLGFAQLRMSFYETAKTRLEIGMYGTTLLKNEISP